MNFKKLFFLTASLFIISYTYSQNVTNFRYVEPNITDTHTDAWLSPHYVVYNKKASKEAELIIFFPGTSEIPKEHSLFIDSIAKNVTHTISMSYPNSLSPWTYCQDKDEACFELFRKEVLWGKNDTLNNIQELSIANSTLHRIIKLLEYLNDHYKEENWSEFISDGNIIWSKIIVSGFSQGGGLSLFISKYYDVKRVVLFSAPSDYLLTKDRSASWLAKTGATANDKIFSFSSLGDDVIPFYIQRINWKAIGLTGNIENLSLNNKFNEHMLIIPTGNHSSVITDTKYSPVWNYLFTTSQSCDNNENQNLSPVLISKSDGQVDIFIQNQDLKIKNIYLYNTLGELILSKSTNSYKTYFLTNNLPDGFYLLSILTEQNKFFRKFWISNH